ncbi:MAG: cation:proton antiporter [Lacipirellulaceae bacterium]
MPHETSLLSTIAVGLAFAFVGGWLAQAVRLPPLVGYLLAGIAVGPFTPGFVADVAIAPQLAEIGVALLMFGVGMHFSIGDLIEVRGVAVPGAIAQIVAATAIGASVAALWGWSLPAGLLLGLALSVASTVVLLRALEARSLLDSNEGRIAIGWLIVEDLAMVLALLVLPAVAPYLGGEPLGDESMPDAAGAARGLGWEIAIALAKVVAFVATMLAVGKRLFPALLRRVEATGSRELFTLAVVTLSLGVAFASAELFGVSLALGAFFAGVVLHESELGRRAAHNLEPLQDVFAALFFVSVGMLFDPRVLVEDPLGVLAVLGIVVIGKSLAACAIVLALGRPWRTALTVSAALAQIGEFSFILIGMGTELGLVPAQALSLVVAGALLSIALNQFVFAAVDRWHPPHTAEP